MNIIFFVAILYSLPLIAAEPPQQKKLNLLTLFEVGGHTSGEFASVFKGWGTNGPLMTIFADGIKQKQNMVVSTPLVKMFLEGSKDRQINDPFFLWTGGISEDDLERYNEFKKDFKNYIEDLKKNWDVRVSTDGNFVVLVPKENFTGKSISQLGFDEENLKNLWDVPTLLGKTTINAESFGKLFNQDLSVRKRIHLVGHGTSETAGFATSEIAQMDQKTYAKFLNILNPTTDFLYVTSCFAGGENLVKMHQDLMEENKVIFSKTSLQFPIALSTITDVEAHQAHADKSFFNALDVYLKNPSASRLKNALQQMYQLTSRSATDLPTVRLPGSNSFFSVADIDKNVKIVTNTILKAYELEFLQKGQKVAPLVVKDQKMLLYPAHITVPLNIADQVDGKSAFISMIQGPSYHVLDEVTAPNLTLKEALKRFDTPSQTIKTFFIKKLVCKDGVYDSVLFQRTFQQTGSIKFMAKVSNSITNPKLDGVYIKKELDTMMSSNFFNTFEHDQVVINPQEARQYITDRLKESTPSQEAFFQATKGLESMQNITADLNNYLSMEFKTPQPKPTQHVPAEKSKIVPEPIHIQKPNAAVEHEISNVAKEIHL